MKSKTFIVAEIGVNHNGNIETAKSLIRYSKWAGADAVKFQMWNVSTFPKLKDLVFSPIAYNHLFSYCESIGIKWFCTPFDVWSVEFLKSLGMDIWKIPSNRIVLDNKEMLEAIGRVRKKRLIMSMGASTMQEALKVLTIIQQNSDHDYRLALLYCISKYPAMPDDFSFEDMVKLKGLGYAFGLSDHSTTISIPIAAVALGASVIEKHITLDRASEGPDHLSSIEPVQFKRMVTQIREVELAIN